MLFPEKYHNDFPENKNVSQQNVGKNSLIFIYESGRKEIKFNNGVRKEVFPDGYQIVYFTNKDIK